MKFLKKFSSQQEKDNFDATAQNVKYLENVNIILNLTVFIVKKDIKYHMDFVK